jgi:hypothetical protein
MAEALLQHPPTKKIRPKEGFLPTADSSVGSAGRRGAIYSSFAAYGCSCVKVLSVSR